MSRIFFALIIFLGGCQELFRAQIPSEIYIDSRYTEEERSLILYNISLVNQELGQELLGQDILIYKGVIAVAEHEPSISNLEDDIHVIYKVDESNQLWMRLENNLGKDIAGWSPSSDVLINSESITNPGLYLHELGHFFGLIHSPFPDTIMHPQPYRVNPEGGYLEHYTHKDKVAFCNIYSCKEGYEK